MQGILASDFDARDYSEGSSLFMSHLLPAVDPTSSHGSSRSILPEDAPDPIRLSTPLSAPAPPQRRR